ncbi:MAG: MAPEG family protein [Rhodoplanes sp.]
MNAIPMITALYAAILGFLGAALTINAIRHRVRSGVSTGDGKDAGLAQAIRAHANFAEQVPLALIVISFAEVLGSRPLVVHVLGVVLVGARLVSAYALNQSLAQTPQRNFSAAVTQLVVVAASAAILLAMAGVR